MDALVFLVAIMVPWIAVAMFGRTRGWWIPGTAIIALGFVPFAITSSDSKSHGSPVDALDGLAGFVALVVFASCLVVGIVTLVAAGRVRAKHLAAQQPPAPVPAPLPVAIALSASTGVHGDS